MSVHVIRGGKARITQAEMDNYLFLQNQIRQLRKRRDAIAQDFIARLEAGADVEPGIHTVELLSVPDGVERRTKVKVK